MKMEDKWIRLGSLSKRVRSDLYEMKKISNELKIAKYKSEPITRSISSIEKFRNVAEEEMFGRNIGDTRVFYGGDDK